MRHLLGNVISITAIYQISCTLKTMKTKCDGGSASAFTKPKMCDERLYSKSINNKPFSDLTNVRNVSKRLRGRPGSDDDIFKLNVRQ